MPQAISIATSTSGQNQRGAPPFRSTRSERKIRRPAHHGQMTISATITARLAAAAHQMKTPTYWIVFQCITSAAAVCGLCQAMRKTINPSAASPSAQRQRATGFNVARRERKLDPSDIADRFTGRGAVPQASPAAGRGPGSEARPARTGARAHTGS